MRILLFVGVISGVIALGAFALFSVNISVWVAGGVLLVTLLLLVELLRSVILPQRTVSRGMELIASQDFNNRLTRVGQVDADKSVVLFNTMIDRLREERLRNLERESFLRLLTDASPMGVLLLDFDGRISMVNPALLRITGISDADELLGHPLEESTRDLLHKMNEVGQGKSRVIRQGDVNRYRCYHLTFMQSGFKRHFYLLETLTEEMMRAEREAYEKVIRIISHEVNNTMGGVRSVLDTVAQCIGEPDLREVLESCDDRCANLTGFINAYADVVRVPQPVLHPEPLWSRLNEMLPFLQSMTRAGISLILHPAETEEKKKAERVGERDEGEVMMVMVDISLFQQVIVNIVKNAVESIDGEGWVRISFNRTEAGAELEIANNGRPISPEEENRIFNPFFTTKPQGCGIGLTLISEILNRHKIRYSLLTHPDGITRFRMLFPERLIQKA